MSKQCYALHLWHGELKWICAHCEALIEECSRILKGALLGAMTTSSSLTSNTREPRPAAKQVEAVKPGVKHIMKESNGKEKITSTKGKKPLKGATVKPLASIEVSARVERLKKDLQELQRSTQALLGRARNALLHNFAEPLIRDIKARREANNATKEAQSYPEQTKRTNGAWGGSRRGMSTQGGPSKSISWVTIEQVHTHKTEARWAKKRQQEGGKAEAVPSWSPREENR
ncbi:unnamed protein product [Echinostoma caproni]|uniref:Retrotransposon protein, putative, unclassified n=1 Tax=Echinostoma caproni TaxID=27848 RepID=A0A183BAM1_9TREM|nr:unnamed protein product [Echinostoma caproni]